MYLVTATIIDPGTNVHDQSNVCEDCIGVCINKMMAAVGPDEEDVLEYNQIIITYAEDFNVACDECGKKV